MSAITFEKLFEPVILDTSDTLLFTVPTPSTTVLRNFAIRFSNNSGVTRAVTVHAVPKGGSEGVSNAVVTGRSVGPNDFIDIAIPDMKEGDFASASLDVNANVAAHSMTGTLYAP